MGVGIGEDFTSQLPAERHPMQVWIGAGWEPRWDWEGRAQHLVRIASFEPSGSVFIACMWEASVGSHPGQERYRSHQAWPLQAGSELCWGPFEFTLF